MKPIVIDGFTTPYSVTSDGKVYSHKYKKWLQPNLVGGYHQVTLYYNGLRRSRLIHRLLMSAYKPTNDNNLQINHIDNNRINNDISNLEWVTAKENSHHRDIQDRFVKLQGSTNGNSKLTESQVMSIREEFKLSKISYAALARKYKVDESLISGIIRYKSWKHV